MVFFMIRFVRRLVLVCRVGMCGVISAVDDADDFAIHLQEDVALQAQRCLATATDEQLQQLLVLGAP